MEGTGGTVAIVGGGIGGLTTALALVRAGWDAQVFERAPRLEAVGAGIQVWANGMRGLRSLDVEAATTAAGNPIDRQVFRSWHGDQLLSVPVGRIAADHRLPRPVLIRRAQLLDVLVRALGNDRVHLGRTFASYEQHDGGVRVRFTDGSEERADVLVGADGVKSQVRRQLLGPIDPRYAGYQYLRAIVSYDGTDVPTDALSITFGRGNRFGIAPLGSGAVYWFAVIPTREGTTLPAEETKRDLLARYVSFPAEVSRLIDVTPATAILRDDIRDLPPLPRWYDRQVTIMGDAAHACTPHGGRGAGEAIDDALALTRHLSLATAPDGVDAALAGFSDERSAVTSVIQRTSRRIGELASWRNPVTVALRERLLRTAAGRNMIRTTEREFASFAA